MNLCPICTTERFEGDGGCCGCIAARQMASEKGITVEEATGYVRAGNEMSRQDRAETPPEELARRQAETDESERRRMAGELPDGTPPLDPEIEDVCRFLAPGADFPHMRARFSSNGVQCWNPRDQIQVFWRPWNSIQGLDIEGPEQIDRRVTAPRVLGAGVLALLAKKNVTKSYVVVTTTGGDEVYFEYEGVTVFQLRAEMSGVTAWFERHREVIGAA